MPKPFALRTKTKNNKNMLNFDQDKKKSMDSTPFRQQLSISLCRFRGAREKKTGFEF
jgi:hypothetical protein